MEHLIPIPVSKELDALEIKLDDPFYLKTQQIVITGTYHFSTREEVLMVLDPTIFLQWSQKVEKKVLKN